MGFPALDLCRARPPGGARGGRSPSGTPGSDILRNSTAIQRVLPMATRRAHKSECGERRRGASRDGGLRRSVARVTCRSQRQQPPRRVSRPRAPANRALCSAAGVATNFATRDALAEAPRPADRAVAVRSATGTPRSARSATGTRVGRQRADVSALSRRAISARGVRRYFSLAPCPSQ